MEAVRAVAVGTENEQRLRRLLLGYGSQHGTHARTRGYLLRLLRSCPALCRLRPWQRGEESPDAVKIH